MQQLKTVPFFSKPICGSFLLLAFLVTCGQELHAQNDGVMAYLPWKAENNEYWASSVKKAAEAAGHQIKLNSAGDPIGMMIRRDQMTVTKIPMGHSFALHNGPENFPHFTPGTAPDGTTEYWGKRQYTNINLGECNFNHISGNSYFIQGTVEDLANLSGLEKIFIDKEMIDTIDNRIGTNENFLDSRLSQSYQQRLRQLRTAEEREFVERIWRHEQPHFSPALVGVGQLLAPDHPRVVNYGRKVPDGPRLHGSFNGLGAYEMAAEAGDIYHSTMTAGEINVESGKFMPYTRGYLEVLGTKVYNFSGTIISTAVDAPRAAVGYQAADGYKDWSIWRMDLKTPIIQWFDAQTDSSRTIQGSMILGPAGGGA